MAHTPGPWGVNADHFVESGDGTLICDPHIEPDGDPPELESNAALLAAAPDLLEACRDVLPFLQAQAELGLDVVTEIEAMERAIAKADGSAVH